MATPNPLTRFTGQWFGLPTSKMFNDIIDRVNGLVSGALQSAASLFSVAYSDVQTAITAFAGGGQTNATALTHLVNSVDTVATAADSVKLPAPTKVGQIVIVINRAANATQVFGSGTDTINAVATATGVSLPAGKMGTYVALTIGTAAKWRLQLGA